MPYIEKLMYSGNLFYNTLSSARKLSVESAYRRDKDFVLSHAIGCGVDNFIIFGNFFKF